MKHRSIAAPLLLPLVTFGISFLVWQVKTKNEMNRFGTSIPTAWLLILPILNIVWLWKYSVGVEMFTRRGLSRHAAFWLMFLLGSIGSAIVQNEFNRTIVNANSPAGMPVTV
ncbi:DUF4234 domain-containing protein [uncultured Arthrobacter sp.]|uniref:DUF4234 domain-containing protein n=1 Tax=uncultured Arthrobacter sp. TaxID=114050 RepID=UPI0028D4B766|nr:DUF4234 domain-containing protein [uncultured Arthrobacter sp.]